MTGYNMPFGCTNADIPGFNSPDEDRPYCERCDEWIEPEDYDFEFEMCCDCLDVKLLSDEIEEISAMPLVGALALSEESGL